jgi:hypothetical protein
MPNHLRATSIAGVALCFLLTLGRPVSGQDKGLPSAGDFMNILALCGAGSGIKIEGDLKGSIASVYEKEKTQGKLVQDIIAKIIELMPEDQRLAAYNAYLGCVDKRLAQNDPKENLELSGTQSFLKQYGISTVTIIDLNIKNRGGQADNISKIKINIKNLFRFNYDPCPMCMRVLAAGVYNVHFKDVVEEANEFLMPHTIAPNSIEKLNLVLGGDLHDQASYLSRITISVHTGSGKVLESSPIDVLIRSFDSGEISPINMSNEAELREFIESGTKAPEILTASVIRRYFAGEGGKAAIYGDKPPSLPPWFF